MTLDFSRCRLSPFQHQREDVAWLLEHPYALIASEMRTGKSKIVVDAAQFMFDAGIIDTMIVVAPAPVRDVWADKALGELAKHLWLNLPTTVTEYHARIRTWVHGTEHSNAPRFDVYVTNFEFLRSEARLAPLLAHCGPKTLLVLDESSFVKNWQAQQTKACVRLRRACGRVVLLNGTPIFYSPMDLFAQGNLLDRSVLDCPYVTHFKARYAIQEAVLGYGGKALTGPRGQVIQRISGWTNLEDLQRRFARCTVRRLQKDCLDLPPKLDSVVLTATLTPETWRAYKDMRDELCVWLKNGHVAMSATAAMRVMRLAQITSGFLGGIEGSNIESLGEGLFDDLGRTLGADREKADGDRDNAQRQGDREDLGRDHRQASIDDLHDRGQSLAKVQEIGREKLDVLLWFIEKRLEEDPNLHLVAWGRFRAEIFRAHDEVARRFPQFETAVVLGGQKRAERLRALALLKPETSPAGPVFVAGIEGTGSFGLDMTASHTCVTIASGYSPGRSQQTLDRVYGPGQQHPIAYYDVVAVGPKGQHTIDHAIVAARRAGEDVATWTAAAWVKALKEE